MKLKQTFVYKGRDGYQAETLTETDANGNIWEIRTSKGRGNVYCYAKQGQDEGKGMISYDMFGGKKLENLAQEAGQCNEAKVKRVHEAGLIAFLKHFENATELEEAYILGPGQIIFTDWVNHEERQVIFETTRPGHFKAVNLEGTEIRNVDRIRPASEKFGIGTYYNDGELMPLDEVQELVKAATEAARERSEKAEKAATIAAIERNQKIAAGIKIVPSIPEGVQAVIVAELHENTSDLMSDYHGHSTKEVVYLAWSAHDRNLFPEMRKAADKFEETKHLGTGKGIFTPYIVNTSEADFILNGHQFAGAEVKRVYFGQPDEVPTFTTMAEAEEFTTNNPLKVNTITAENGDLIGVKWAIQEGRIQQDYPYNYLKDGHSDSSGWAVKKQRLGQYGPTLETLQIAAAEGRFLCNVEPEPTNEPTPPQYEAQEVTAGTVQIIDYSQKAIAVIGDTKPIKDKLKALGGKFNFRLTCGAGWIFPKTQLEKVQKALTTKAEPEPDFSEKYDRANEPREPLRLIGEPTPDPETIAPEPTEDEAQAIAAEEDQTPTAQEIAQDEAEKLIKDVFNIDEDGIGHAERPARYCTPRPAPSTGFFRESGSGIPAPKVTPQVPAAWSKHGAEQEQNGLKLYSETQQGTNTGRAQQGFLF